jgi:hypothetical protein
MYPRLATAALLALALNAHANDKQPGLAVGARAPAFKLKDQHGKERSLDEWLKQGKVALMFYRSADW